MVAFARTHESGSFFIMQHGQEIGDEISMSIPHYPPTHYKSMRFLNGIDSLDVEPRAINHVIVCHNQLYQKKKLLITFTRAEDEKETHSTSLIPL